MSEPSGLTSTKNEMILSDSDFSELRTIIHENTGISIADNRRSMLVSRLQRRLRETGESTFGSYISRVSAEPLEMQELINRVTTNETYFYRTPRVWAHFREIAIPEILKLNGRRNMKVWSAAASTGEEAYSIGVVLEEVRCKNFGFDYSVLGTDISSRVIEVAQRGCYIGRPISKFRKDDPDLFGKYLIGDDISGYQAIPEVRKRITFTLHNLISELKSGGPFDIVFLRNVLIYFSNRDQEKILSNVHKHIRPNGYLYIGESETLTSLNSRFYSEAPLVYRPTCVLER